MALLFYKWSKTSASNATADANVGWAEGQSPSSVNDSARAMMSSAAGFRDDISGSLVTAGSATAYTLTTNQIFDNLTNLGGQLLAFTPHASNTNAVGVDVTLAVDGLAAKAIRMQPSVPLPGGTLILGTVYVCTYNNTDGAFYLHNMTNPYAIPLGGMIDYAGSTAPNSSLALPYGQAISRTTYATLFTLISTTYGVGDGSSTFNLPDCRGRVVAGKDDMGGSAASRLTATYFGTSAAALGAVGGSESTALTAAQIPSLTSTGNNSISVTPNGFYVLKAGSSLIVDFPSTAGSGLRAPGNTASMDNAASFVGSNSISVTTSGTSGNAHRTVPPTIVANKLIRII